MTAAIVARLGDQGTRIAVPELDLHGLLAQRRERLLEIDHVEADGQAVGAAFRLQLFLRFLLLGVVRGHFQLSRRKFELDPAILLVGEDRGALQRRSQQFPIDSHRRVGPDRDHRLIVRKAAVDQLRGEAHVLALDPQVIATHFEHDLPVTPLEQPLQLMHTLARQDQLSPGLDRLRQLRFAQRQAVTIGGDAAEHIGIEIHQQPVQVIAHILLGHGEAGSLDELAQRGLRNPHPLDPIQILDRWKVVRRQTAQDKTAAARVHRRFLVLQTHRDPAAVRQRPDQVEQFPGRDRGLAVAGILHRATRDHFDFQVGRGHRQLTRLDLAPQIGEHRQRVPTFHHIHHLLQGLEKDFTLKTESHAWPLGLNWITLETGGGGVHGKPGKVWYVFERLIFLIL